MLLVNDTQLLEGPDTAGTKCLLNLLLVGNKHRLDAQVLEGPISLITAPSQHAAGPTLPMFLRCPTTGDCSTPAVSSQIIACLFSLLDFVV